MDERQDGVVGLTWEAQSTQRLDRIILFMSFKPLAYLFCFGISLLFWHISFVLAILHEMPRSARLIPFTKIITKKQLKKKILSLRIQ
jgi:hypothetical protein